MLRGSLDLIASISSWEARASARPELRRAPKYEIDRETGIQPLGVIARVQLNSFDVPCGPSQEGPDSPSYPNYGDAYNQKCFPSLAHLLP